MVGAPITARCLAIRGGRRTHVRAALLVALVALSVLRRVSGGGAKLSRVDRSRY